MNDPLDQQMMDEDINALQTLMDSLKSLLKDIRRRQKTGVELCPQYRKDLCWVLAAISERCAGINQMSMNADDADVQQYADYLLKKNG
jgi:hypothetical protein